MIRRATFEDVETLVKIGAAFHKQTPVPLEYDPSAMRGFIASVVKNGAVFLGPEGGTLGAVLAPLPYGGTQAVELWWWAKGDALPLLDAFENWSREAGADCAALTTFREYPKLMASRGYGAPQFTRYKVL